MKLLVIACSLNPHSRSALLAAAAVRSLETLGQTVEFLDLRDLDLPMCDAGAAYGGGDAQRLAQAVLAADAILLAVPIYNYDVNAAAKNVIELTGKAWSGKTVGFLCAAGGQGSYMSVMPLANSLMLDFRSFIIPRFIYATGKDFTEADLPAEPLLERIHELAAEITRVATALTHTTPIRDSRPL